MIQTGVWCDTGVGDAELVELLKNAGLSELLRRVGSLDSPVSWNWYELNVAPSLCS